MADCTPLLATALRPTDTPTCVVHIGAGPGAELPGLLALGAKRLVLVEGDPATADELELAAGPSAEVLRAVVSPAGGPANWHTVSVPGLSGLRPPTSALLRLYPRLRSELGPTRRSVTLAELLTPLGLDPKVSNLLLLDLPGSEDDLLATLPEALLTSFEWIELRGSAEPLYEGASFADAALRRLQAQGYELVAQDLDRRPAWPRRLLRLDRQRVELQKLAQQLATLDAALRDSEEAVATLRSERTMLSKALADQSQRTDEREELLRQATQNLQEQRGLATQRSLELDALAQARDEQANLAAERLKLLEQVTQARDSQAKLAAERQAQLAKLVAARDQAEQVTVELRIEIERLQRSAHERDVQLAEMEAQLADATRREKAYSDEMTRAAAQIDLIKDLLLREPGL
jgi:predicted  nucleic acid-binding Zn-ribbon protein